VWLYIQKHAEMLSELAIVLVSPTFSTRRIARAKYKLREY